MGDVNWFEFVFNTYERLIGFINAIYNFLYHEFEILDYTISLWQFMGGAAITGILVAAIIKKVVPFL